MKRPRESVVCVRPVQVERIPDGTLMELSTGTAAEITQSLGSSFTLLVDGQLMRLKGSDADAIGRAAPPALDVPKDVGLNDVEGLVWQVLKTCYDPEIPVDVVELGLIYGCDVVPVNDDEVRVSIRMTLTAPGCGMGQGLGEEVADKLVALPRVAEANVQFVFDPPWDRSRMSDAAALELGL